MPGWSTWSLWGLVSYQQGYDALAKQDTLFLAQDAGGGIADLAVDRSQYLDNQATGATWTFEAAPASRFNLSNQWCYEFDFTCDNTDTGRLFQYDCATAASDLSLRISAGGIMAIIINNAVAGTTLTLPGISGSDQRFVFQWSAEANTDTTGASDALTHYLCAWNLNTGAFDKTRLTTVVRPTQTGAMVVWAGTTAGSNPFTGTPHGVRMSGRLHSTTETAHDFVSSLSTPGTMTQTEDQGLPVSSSIGFAGSSHFHGPAAAWATDATRRMFQRLMSPLWNECMRISTELSQGELDAIDDPWIRGAPGDTAWRMHLSHLRGYPVPPGATHLWARVQLRSYVTSSTAVPLGVRLYSLNRNPASVGALTSYYAEEVVDRDDAAVEGSYVLKLRLPIARDDDGFTWLALAFNVDPNDASSNDNRERVRVQAVHVVPICCDEQGGLGFGQVGT